MIGIEGAILMTVMMNDIREKGTVITVRRGSLVEVVPGDVMTEMMMVETIIGMLVKVVVEAETETENTRERNRGRVETIEADAVGVSVLPMTEAIKTGNGIITMAVRTEKIPQLHRRTVQSVPQDMVWSEGRVAMGR
jgi:hypothetical protein